MERQSSASTEARLVRAARSLERNRTLRAQAEEREAKAQAALLEHLVQTGQSQAVLGLFEITRADEDLTIRRLPAEHRAQLPLPQMEELTQLQEAQPKPFLPSFPTADGLYHGYRSEGSAARQVHFLAPEDAQLQIFLEDMLEQARRLNPNSYRAPSEKGFVLEGPAQVYNLLAPRMVDLPQEQLRLLTLTTRNTLLREHFVYQGVLNSAPMRVADVFRLGLADNAAGLILAHNHPSGDPSPSESDVRVTQMLVEAGRVMDMQVLDHIIVARQGYVSLKERGLGF